MSCSHTLLRCGNPPSFANKECRIEISCCAANGKSLFIALDNFRTVLYNIFIILQVQYERKNNDRRKKEGSFYPDTGWKA